MKYVYHGSPIPNLKIIKAKESTHMKKWVYACTSKAISTIFLSQLGNDLYYSLSGDGIDYQVELVERKSDMFKKIFKIKESNSISKILVNSVVIIVLILGIYTTYRTEYFTKVTNTLTYVAQHIKPQDIEAPEGNGYEKEHLTFTDLSITYGSIISIFAISTYYSDVAIKEYNKSKLTKKDNKKIVEEA